MKNRGFIKPITAIGMKDTDGKPLILEIRGWRETAVRDIYVIPSK
jgi:hypothetical protein